MKKNVLLILTALLPFFGLYRFYSINRRNCVPKLRDLTIISFLIANLISLSIYASSISVSGTISTDFTWAGVDTVKVTGDIYVNNGITLSINPGIFVVFQDHYKLEVDGRLLAIGTEADTITFTAANNNTGWNRIVFDFTTASNDSSKIVYCKLEYGKASTPYAGMFGGAIFVAMFDKVLISNCLFENNYAGTCGGAIYCNGSSIVIGNCIFSNNESDQGGALYIRNYCNPLLINNLIANNDGIGGIYTIDHANGHLINNTITGNYRGLCCNEDSDLTLTNTLIYGNSVEEVYLFNDNCDPDFYYCDIQGGIGGFGGTGSGSNFSGDYLNCIDINPQFIDSGGHPYDLSGTSPCINSGDPATTVGDVGEYDLSGGVRFQNIRIDIGAYESSGTPGGLPGYALEFDGIDDYVSIPSDNSLNTQQFTVEFWMAASDPGQWQGILDKGWNTSSDWYFVTGSPGNTEGVVFGTGDGSSRHEIHYSWNDSLWHHVAGTYDGTMMRLYIDGQLKNTYTATYLSSSNNIIFGRRSNLTYPFEGKLDEVAIWDYARTIQDIREGMHLTYPATEPSIVAYWQFNEGTGIYCNEFISDNNGTMVIMNNDDWILSTIPIGHGQSVTHTISTTGIVLFDDAGVEMDVTQKTGTDIIVVTRIDRGPNINPTTPDEFLDTQYWVINKFGSGTITANINFSVNEDLSIMDEENPHLTELHSRSGNADTEWMFLSQATAVNSSTDQAEFSNISQFGQFIIGKYFQPDYFPGTALTFDGIDEYVRITHNNGLPIHNSAQYDLTITMWVKGPAQDNRKVFAEGASSMSNNHFSIGTTNDGKVEVYVIKGNGTVLKHQVSTNIAFDNTWHHIAWIEDNNNQKLLIDGVEDPSNFKYDRDYIYFNRTVIGALLKSSPSNFFEGIIDEVQIWDNDLSVTQVRENMHKTLSGAESNLVSYFQFNEGTGNTTVDLINENNGTLINMEPEDSVNSTLPTGGGVSNTQNETAGTVDYTGTGLSMYYNAQNSASVTATRIDISPNMNPDGLLTSFDSQYWVVNRFGSGTFDADLTFTINEDLTAADESDPANISLYTRGSNTDTSWVFLTLASSVDAATDQATFDGITGLSQFIIAREVESSGLRLDVSVFLEGPYNETTSLMLPNLNPDVIPLSQPYNTAPWNYSGTESVETIPADVVDWVLIELRDATDASLATGETMVAQQAAFLLNDGSVVGLDGVEKIHEFSLQSISNNLFVVIYHRNHLCIMSANPLTESGGVYTYDYTTPPGQAYGTDAQKNLGGIYGMYAGDGDANGTIDSDDKNNIWSLQAGKKGYYSGDFDMDGQVMNQDKNDVWNGNRTQQSQVPN